MRRARPAPALEGEAPPRSASVVPSARTDRIRWLFAVLCSVLLPTLAVQLWLTGPRTAVTILPATLLVATAGSIWTSERIGHRPWFTDVVDPVVLVTAALAFPTSLLVHLAGVVVAGSAALHRGRVGRRLLVVSFGLPALAFVRPGVEAAPEALVGTLAALILVTQLVGALGDVGRDADRALWRAGVLARAAGDLGRARHQGAVAQVVTEAAWQLLEAPASGRVAVTAAADDGPDRVLATVGGARDGRDGAPAPVSLELPLEHHGRRFGDLRVVGDPVLRAPEDALAALAALAASTLEGLGLLDELAARKRHLAVLLESSADLVTVLDDQRVVRFHRGGLHLVGWRPADLVGEPLVGFAVPEDRARIELELERVLAAPDGRGTFDWRLRGADGTIHHLETTAADLRGDATVRGVLLNSRDVTDRKELERELAHRALHDPLTGLVNRACFQDRVEHALARRSTHPPVLVFLDLDDFKAVNDLHGHQTGDALLLDVAATLRQELREADTAARFGGDEFAVLLEDLAEDAVPAIVERLMARLVDPTGPADTGLPVRASLGIAAARPGWTERELLQAADTAMYAAKAHGKGTWCAYTDELTSPGVAAGLLADLHHALARGELSVVYQPLVDLRSRRIAGLEALLRWEHATQGPISPVTFIPMAERSELMVPIGDFVLATATAQLAAWQREHGDRAPASINVNLSPVQLRPAGAAGHLLGIIAASGVEPSAVTLELTESALIADLEATATVLAELRDAGVRVAIDDFGAGHAGLGYLQHLGVDELKIDRDLVEALGHRGFGDELVRTALDLSVRLGLTATAEGIEDADQLSRLTALGCDQAQGFLLARPVPAAEIRGLLTGEVAIGGASGGPGPGGSEPGGSGPGAVPGAVDPVR